MNDSRRQFILGAANSVLAAGVLSTSILSGCSWQAKRSWLVSSCDDHQGKHLAAALDLDGKVISTVTLPARGHDALALPHKPSHALIFARRPGKFALEVDFSQGQIVKQFQSQGDSHFYGHGVFSKDGRYMYTTENLYDKNQGVVVVRDAKTYQVLDRFDSGGIGPHELVLMPDGKTLAVANGGIQTHPEQPRKKLNLDTMQPNLAYIDIASTKVLDSYQPSDHQLSLRHLDVAADGEVIIGAQYQGHNSAIRPLLFAHQGQDNLQAFDADEQQWYNMQQYTASVLVNNNQIFVSCPRGSHLSFWDRQSKTFSHKQKFKDVSGLTQSKQTVLASSGRGVLKQINQSQTHNLPNQQTNTLKFDNHMTVISAV